MNTQKQVLIMSALLMVILIMVGIYGAWYPSREDDAAIHFEEQTAERGSILFARNCRLCHGNLAEGGALGARLVAAPALNRPDLQGFADSKATLSNDLNQTATSFNVSSATSFRAGQIIMLDTERLEVEQISGNSIVVKRAVGHTEAELHSSGTPIYAFDAAVLTEVGTLITNTIACGRVGTAMPAWAQVHGGPLSDEQIRQLKVLITTARWDLVAHEIDVEDEVAASLTEAIPGDETFIGVSDVTVFNDEEALRIGDERLRVKSVPEVDKEEKDKSGFIVVERGVLGTIPLDHGEEETIFRFAEVSEPSINQASCGQTARPAAPAGDPALIEPFEGQTVSVTAQNIVFNLREITARTGGRIRVRLDNQDAGVQHNIAFYQSSTTLTPVSPGSVGLTFAGVATDDTAFDVPAVGSYIFRCDVHPTTMTGTFTVTN